MFFLLWIASGALGSYLALEGLKREVGSVGTGDYIMGAFMSLLGPFNLIAGFLSGLVSQFDR